MPVLNVPMPGTAPTTAFGVLPNQSSPAQIGVVTSPVTGPSPTLAPIRTSIDSLDSDPGRSSFSSAPSKVDPSVVTPWPDVTFDPSVSSISPRSLTRTAKTAQHPPEIILPSVCHSAKLPPDTCVDSIIKSDSKVDAVANVRARQAHLVKLYPHFAQLADHPFTGKRIKICKLLLCDSLFQNGQAASPINSAPVDSWICGKHRELYYAHRDALKCQDKERYGLGIKLVIKGGPVMECRAHLQARLFNLNTSPSDTLSQRSSSRTSNRSRVADAPVTTTECGSMLTPMNATETTTVDSSSSSGLPIPELVAEVEDGGVTRSDSVGSFTAPVISQSFAQNVRGELDSLSTKSASADLPHWADHANKKIGRPRTRCSEEGCSRISGQTAHGITSCHVRSVISMLGPPPLW